MERVTLHVGDERDGNDNGNYHYRNTFTFWASVLTVSPVYML